jgi:hypothetical protein
MKPNTPPSYSKIFEIWKGTTYAAGFTPGATYTTRDGNTLAPFMPPHRGLYVSSSTTACTVVFTNIDGTTAQVFFPAATEIVLPIIIKGYAQPSSILSSAVYINGLL